jgi:hypothetical protein
MSIVLTRKELYDRVRSEPMQRLSKELRLSDVSAASDLSPSKPPAPDNSRCQCSDFSGARRRCGPHRAG